MRFLLSLHCLSPIGGLPPLIPFNYPYRLSSWLYHLLGEADQQYATFLHEKGYQSAATASQSGKTFKLFTFSDLQPTRYNLNPARGGIELLSPKVHWTTSFYVEKAAETFITGLFLRQECRLASRNSELTFQVEGVAAKPLALTTDSVALHTLSPLVVAQKQPDGKDHYLHPNEENFGHRLIGNLIDKYRSVHPAAPVVSPEAFSYRLLRSRKEPRSRLMVIKEGFRQETKIRGYYDFSFELTGPKEYLEVGLCGGLGRYNAEGCGCVEVLGDRLVGYNTKS